MAAVIDADLRRGWRCCSELRFATLVPIPLPRAPRSRRTSSAHRTQKQDKTKANRRLGLAHHFLAVSLFFGSSAISYAQASFSDRRMQAIVGAPYQGVKSSGTLTLSSAGVSFDSPDFVFTLPADEIQAVESKGARDGFVTFVIDSHSKFLQVYPTLVSQRSHSIGEGEQLLTVSLAPTEPVDTELMRVKAYGGVHQGAPFGARQATVGASAAAAASTPADREWRPLKREFFNSFYQWCRG